MNEAGSFGYWSGYSPGKRGPDRNKLVPLDATELRSEAVRFREEADRRRLSGRPGVEKLEAAAADFDVQANRLDAGLPATESKGTFFIDRAVPPAQLRVDAIRMRQRADVLGGNDQRQADILRRHATFLEEEADRRGSDPDGSAR